MKTVVVIPAGRKRFLNILLFHLYKQIDDIDEIRLWVNTNIKEDLKYMTSLTHEKITLDWRPYIIHRKKGDKGGKIGDNNADFAINLFFDKCVDEDTIYIRLDDDIVWLDDNFIKNIVQCRLNSNAFLVYGNIINNKVINKIHNIKGNGIVQHRQFLKILKYDSLSYYKKSNKYCFKDTRISVNAICWYGKEFKKFDGIVAPDEERWLSLLKPNILKIYNEICMSAICVHYSFHTQFNELEKTDILKQYEKLI